ncbi:hypothetical protein MRX96_028064 [Rhipicephalus microplus]
MSQAVVQNDLLISLVYEQRVLWDKRLAAYKNIDARTAAWIAVATSLGLAGTQGDTAAISKRWRNLRDTFCKKLRESKKEEWDACCGASQLVEALHSNAVVARHCGATCVR